MKIIWADHDPSWGIPDREEIKAEAVKAKESSALELSDESAQEKAPRRS
jgi:hypothetical protein